LFAWSLTLQLSPLIVNSTTLIVNSVVKIVWIGLLVLIVSFANICKKKIVIYNDVIYKALYTYNDVICKPTNKQTYIHTKVQENELQKEVDPKQIATEMIFTLSCREKKLNNISIFAYSESTQNNRFLLLMLFFSVIRIKIAIFVDIGFSWTELWSQPKITWRDWKRSRI